MTHLFFLRALGLLLICALIANISIVLAAPFYMDAAQNELMEVAVRTQPGDLDEGLYSSATTEIHEHGKRVEGFDQEHPAPTRGDTQRDDAQDNTSLLSGGRLDLEQSSKQVLSSIGSGLGKSPAKLPQRIAAAAKHFTPNEITTLNTESKEVISASPSEALSPAAALPINGATAEQVVLINPSQNNLTVSFLLDGKLQSLLPGAELIEDGTDLSIQFDRGGNFGAINRRLSAGTYQFEVSRTGWKLTTAADVD